MDKMKPLLTSIVLLLACRMHSMLEDDQRPEVNAPRYGLVRGLSLQADNGARVNAFLGLPYASAPDGFFRFQHTYILIYYKNTIYEANKMPPACPQYSEQPLPCGSGDIPITLVGEGSGAMLVSLLRLSIIDKFQMVLNGATALTLQSLEGVDRLGDAYFNNLRLTDLLAKKLGCGSLNNSKSAIACLREVDASRLMRVAASLSRGRGPPNVFLPQFNSSELYQANPNMLLHISSKYTTFDTFATFASDDGSALLTSAFPKLFGVFGEKDVPLSAANATKAARRFLNKFPVTVGEEMLGHLDEEPTLANREKTVQAFGDAYFNCPMVFYAEELKSMKEGKENTVGVHLLEKKVSPPWKPLASWIKSVSFDVQPDELTVNNQTYQDTDEQSEQFRTNQELLKTFMKKQELPFPKFTPEDPAYGVLDSEGKLSEERNFHSRNCDILRPYYKYQKDKYFGYGFIIKE